MKILINDNLYNSSEGHLSIYDLGLNRGFAIFDFFKIVDGKFRFFEDHLSRFLNSIRKSKIPFNYSRAQVKQKITELKSINNIENGYVRITLTAGHSDNFTHGTAQSNLIVIIGNSSLSNSSDQKRGVKLISKYYQRSIPSIKTTDYFFAQMNQAEMIEKNAVDILYYTSTITETSRANIFFIKNHKLVTPKSNILEGITRKQILRLYPDTILQDISRDEIPDYDEAFICSSTKEVTPVLHIDDFCIGNGAVGPNTKEVLKKFKELRG